MNTMDRHQSEVEEEMENTRMIAQCKDWIASEVCELPEGCWLYKEMSFGRQKSHDWQAYLARRQCEEKGH